MPNAAFRITFFFQWQAEITLKFLIVDDNAAVRRLIASVVLPFAREVHECVDGAEALSAYQAQGPDFVLMDIQMSGLDGIQATRQIKAADPAAKVVIVTDYDDNALREEARRSGACGYALKDNLLDLIPLLETIAPLSVAS